MRRSRISIKPNFKPGSRTGTEGEKTSVDNTGKAEELEEQTQSHQQSATLKESVEDVGLKGIPEMPTKLNQNNGAPSSGDLPSSTAPHRRMRISAAPKLVRPKLGSTHPSQTSSNVPRLVAPPQPSSAQSAILDEKHVLHSASEAQTSVSLISNSLSNLRTPIKSTSATEPSSTKSPSISQCASGKNAVELSPPSPQPGQVPQQPSQESELSECPSNLSLTNSKPSESDKAGSSDKDRILRTLKLKELMKIERRKDIQKGKKRVGHKDYTAVDRSKMTMRDLIYYLPNTSPMRSSVECENPEETVIPPSPTTQIKTAEKDEEEEEEVSDNEEKLMPRVRVAEDGSIILDEDSLTVRVQRSSNTKLVENSTLFERGSTTTYASFRKQNHVKNWSVRETDLFFLAISMVGTDFSMIGQLLPHRCRPEIKNKFKKEEKVNPWRIDKALRNCRPFDKEFFSYLLEKVLTKDLDKRKSIKLVLPKTKKPRRSKGKQQNKTTSDDMKENDIINVVEEELDDDEVANEDKRDETLSNEKEGITPKKRQKRTRDSNFKDKDESSEEHVKKKRQRRTTKEVHSNKDGEGESNLNDDGDSLNVNKKDELEKTTSIRLSKHSKDDEERQSEKPVQRRKGTQIKKSLKDESVSQHEESCIVDGEGSATKKKRKRAKNMDLDVEEPVVEKRKAKKKRPMKSTLMEKVNAEEVDSSTDLQEAGLLNTPKVQNNISPKATQQCKKPSPELARTKKKKDKVPETSAEIDEESQVEENHESVLTAADSLLEDKRLQMQAVVVLENTPPRQQYSLSPSKIKCKHNDLEQSMSSASSDESSTHQSRLQRAGRVKRSISKKAKSRKESKDPYVNPMVLLESIAQEDEDEDEDVDDSLNENLVDLSCLHELDSQVFQKRPMVVLSREEVDMILNTSEQSSEEDPSVSPLDLSLNTELSFPFQCSKLLEDNDAADVVDCMKENEQSTNVGASCGPKNFEELEQTESALAQPDISSLWDNSTPVKLEVCSQPEIDRSNVTSSCSTRVEPQVHPLAQEDVTVVAAMLDVPPPLAILENFEPICMKRETQETTTSKAATLSILTVVSDFIDESKNVVLPSLHEEKSKLDSSENTAPSKLTSEGNGLGSQRPLQADEDMQAELQKSLEGPQTLETTLGVSQSREDTQEPAMEIPEIKMQTQSCAVGLEVTEDSQKERSARSRRSRILKPKPNLNQKSRAKVPQIQDLERDSALKLKSIETSPTQKPINSPTHDLQDPSKNVNNQDLKKVEEPNTSAQMESEATKDLSDASITVKRQESISSLAQGPGSAAKPQELSECCSVTCDVDVIPPCSSPQSLQNLEDRGSGQTIVPSEDIFAPAEIFHLTDDTNNNVEPTFILTLYEIPVTEPFLPSSSNDTVMISDLPIVQTQASIGFSEPALSLPSTSGDEPLRLQTNSDVVAKDLLENGENKNLVNTSDDIPPLKTINKDCDTSTSLERSIVTLQPHCVPFDLAPSHHDTKCTTLHQDSEQWVRDSHMMLADIFVPVSADLKDDLSKDVKMAVNTSKVNVTENLAENFTEQISEESSSQETVLLDTKYESNVTHLDHHPECRNSSEIAPCKNLSSRILRTPSRLNTSKCITLHQDPKDTEQCAEVSHVLLDDVFVPVIEELGNNITKATENINLSEGQERQEAPFEEEMKVNLTENKKKMVEDLPSVSSPLLCFDTTKELEKSKASPRRSKRQKVKPQPKLIKRTSVKVDSSTIEVESKKDQPTSSHLNLPTSCKPNRSGISEKKMPSIKGTNKGKGDNLHFIKEKSPEILETKPITTNLHLSKESKVEQEESTNVMGDTIHKADIETYAEDNQLSTIHCNVLRSPGSGLPTIDTRIEARDVSHKVLPDVFVLVSDVMKDNDCTEAMKSSLQRASLTERATSTHFKKELITEDGAQRCVEDLAVEIKTPVRKRTIAKPSQQSPQATSSSSTQLNQRDMLLLEEKLQKKHYIIPCSVKLSSLDTADQNLYASQLGDRRSSDKTTAISSPAHHVNVITVSGEPNSPLLFEEGQQVEKKSPERRNGKTTESSPDKKHGHSKPVQTSLHTRQLTIKDWVKTSKRQTETNRQKKQSSAKAKDQEELMVEKTCSKSGHPEEPVCSHFVPSMEKTKDVNSASTEVKRLSEMVTDKSVAEVKSPPKRRAKLQVKPILHKRLYPKGNTSTSDQQQITRFNSPTRHGVRAAREKEETEKNICDTSRDEAHLKCKGSPIKTSESLSPKSQTVWPRVVLPRVKFDTTEAGICSASQPTSSHNASPPQIKKFPTPSRSPAANENLDDDPAKVSQFFLSDIFTKVDEAE